MITDRHYIHNKPVDSSPEHRRTNPCDLEVGKFGFALFLISLGVFFAASIVGYLVIRLRAEVWPPVGAPAFPSSLWISTAVIILTSVAIQWAVNSIQQNHKEKLLLALYISAGLGILFLILQSANWFVLYQRELMMKDNLYAFTFYLLTGLHALHVIGGLIPMFITIHKARQELYTSYHYNGIYYLAMYWHFLDGVWIVLYTTLLIGS
jgi:heme/copper-type cytochrome/quinol oxidase subunit 3